MEPVPPPEASLRRRLLLVRAAGLIGLVLTTALTWQAFAAGPIPGCGPASACSDVLASPWSRALGVPVAAMAVLVYVAVLGASAAPARPAGRAVLGLGGTVLIAAAIWFGLVQAVILEAFCPLCMAAHVMGLVTGGVATRLARPRLPVVVAGVAAVALLAVVQAVQPDPPSADRQTIGFQDSGPGPDRAVLFNHGAVGARLSVHQTPHLGDPDAPAVLIEFFDYTCGFCRAMHAQLEAVRAAFPGQVVVVTIPVPLSGDCNPTLAGEAGHPESCAIDRLALAVWRADRAAFETFHNQVWELGPDPAAAHALAEELVGAEALDAALADPEIDAQLARNSELFARLEGKLPQVIAGRMHIRGLPPTPDVLIGDVAEQFGLTPIQSPADPAPEAAAAPPG